MWSLFRWVLIRIRWKLQYFFMLETRIKDALGLTINFFMLHLFLFIQFDFTACVQETFLLKWFCLRGIKHILIFWRPIYFLLPLLRCKVNPRHFRLEQVEPLKRFIDRARFLIIQKAWSNVKAHRFNQFYSHIITWLIHANSFLRV